MATIFRAKLRRIGNSLGILIPREIIEDSGFKGGDVINVSIPSSGLKTRNEKLREMAGRYEGKCGFEREKGDRY